MMWIFFPNPLLRGWLFLKCAAAGMLGGLVLILTPSLGMFWQGLALIGVGALSMAIFAFGLRVKAPAGRSGGGPTFDTDAPDAAEVAPTTTRLIDGIRRERGRRRRA